MKKKTWLVPLLALVCAACAWAQGEPLDMIADPLVEDLSGVAGYEDLLAHWLVDDGQTVSLLWRFDTDERFDLLPDIEMPNPGDYPWYVGSSLSIVDPHAVWTPEGWTAQDDGLLLSASDSNPHNAEQKIVWIAVWHKKGQKPPKPKVTPEPTLRIKSKGTTTSRADRRYEVTTFEAKFTSLEGCPTRVSVSLPLKRGQTAKILAWMSWCEWENGLLPPPG